MNIRSLALFATGACCALLVTASVVRSQESEAGDPSDPAAMAAMVPGPMHAHLAAFAGDWKVEGKWRMTPGDEWVPFRGQATRQLILDGRHLLEDFSSEFMGEPFVGKSLTGYDNLREEFTSVWIDNSSTGTMISTGGANEAGTEITLEGMHSEALSGTTDKWFRIRYRITGPDENVFESYTKSTPDGEAWLSMELVYTRK